MKKNIAVYAGTFDPVTNGHLDIIERASRMFDTLYVTICINPNKQGLKMLVLELLFEELEQLWILNTNYNLLFLINI